MRIALISLDQHWQKKELNLKRCEVFIKKAIASDCKLIIFPEMTLTGFSIDSQYINDSSESIKESKTMKHFADLSQNYKINIIYGLTLKEKYQTLAENVICLAEPTSGSKKIYSKVHPFTFAGERKVIKEGKNLGLFDLDGIKFNTSICYDLRFPSFYNSASTLSDCIICIACWPEKRVHHWDALLVARAIENQSYMIGVNCTGIDGNGLYYKKSSKIVSPNGDKITAISEDKEIDIYNIDKKIVETARKEFPFLQDSNPSLYLKLSNSQKLKEK